MPTVTVKFPPDLLARLEAEAARLGTSKSAVLRDTYARAEPVKALSFAERARHLIGTIDGPGNLSARSKKMVGYGRFRRP
ncbi:MAG: CopG family transcriptional regulator [Opitutaceae bacterium]|jgi:Ribbon-helix-helix protein, copG family|nr:CopG family transcriptional regulator [Opitutaceae bacterium]